jgi:hypothetical protein
MESNLLIGHKHDKKIFVIERFVINVLWKRIILYLWYRRELDLCFIERKYYISVGTRK